MERRPYQHEALRAFTDAELRFWAMLWERQSGKSTTFADMALYAMMRRKWATCIYASASLLLSQEIVLKQAARVDMSARELVEKDAGVLHQAAARYAAEVDQAGLMFRTADGADGTVLGTLSVDDFADLFEKQRLEFRVYHSETVFSRTKVIAPNVATARSWTGTVFLDEVAFIRGLRELIVALLPVISTHPDFRLVMGTTPPEFDDTHYSFELLAPPAGTEFRACARGNWYESEAGVRVHRADCYDTHAAGKVIYDVRTGDPITPEEALKRAPNKDGHRIAHELRWMIGGAAACDLQRLRSAQERGIGQCQCLEIDSDSAMDAAMAWLEARIDPQAPVGLGFDVATTEKGKSNPSVLAVAEEHGPEIVIRQALIWKTRDPDVARERIARVLRVVAARPGKRARALSIDATSERYFAEDCRKEFGRDVPVLLVVASERVDRPGLEKPTNWKEFLGDQYVAKLDDNRLTLPPEAYLRIDHRLVRKDRGRYVCEADEDGRHGDTFDAGKLACHSLLDRSGALESADQVRHGGRSAGAPRFVPHKLTR